MLNLAQSLYTGRGNPLAIVQGSYVDNVPESFGTHAGGGAVDISVRVKSDPRSVLDAEEMTQLVTVLRQAGFAAWARLPGDLDPATPLHIHAIAIGDRELSDAARRQLDGPEGYFRGLNWVPHEYGGPQPDRYGGPLIVMDAGSGLSRPAPELIERGMYAGSEYFASESLPDRRKIGGGGMA
jgi:hypothetical protein